jgi:hypothetical protein
VHSKKLANRFLDEHKVPLRDRNNAAFVARIHSTVQKAVDSGDDAMLFSPINEQHNLNFVRPLRIAAKTFQFAAMAATMYGLMRSRLGIAAMGLLAKIAQNFTSATAQTLGYGSGSLLFSLLKNSARLIRALGQGMLNGMVSHYQSGIQPLLCRIARITLSNP